MALQLRKKTHESVVYIDRDSAPRIMPSGEDFILEDLPIGTRVLYPNPPIKGLPNREAAIRYALNHPHGCDPLFAQLEPGLRVTVAVDDISLPLPPMATPDIRQTVLEIVLDMLAGHGVDDVHIIIANSLHRKMTEWEMKRMVGKKIFDDYYPDRYYNHDAEWIDGLIKLGETKHKEPLTLNRRAAESDLLIYVNINLVPMDGGHKSVAVGLCDYESFARIMSHKQYATRTVTWIQHDRSWRASVTGSEKLLTNNSTSFTSRLRSTIGCTKATWTFYSVMRTTSLRLTG